MPLRIRFKIALVLLLSGFLLALIYRSSALAAILCFIPGLLYLEMIYPKLNFFSKSLQNVRHRGENSVALTFDDGPSTVSLEILKTLREKSVRATFFLLGENLERHPEIARKIQDEGHTIGVHGYSHTKFHLKGPGFIRADLDRAMAAFQRAGVQPKPLIRFPHGFKNIFAVLEAKRRGLKICGWGKGVWDSKRPGVNWIVRHSLQLKPGEILLLHDGDGTKPQPDRTQTAEALGPIIDGLRQKKYSFVTLDE